MQRNRDMSKCGQKQCFRRQDEKGEHQLNGSKTLQVRTNGRREERRRERTERLSKWDNESLKPATETQKDKERIIKSRFPEKENYIRNDYY